jgi:DNA-binding LytR/AlgR family response regulator
MPNSCAPHQIEPGAKTLAQLRSFTARQYVSRSTASTAKFPVYAATVQSKQILIAQTTVKSVSSAPIHPPTFVSANRRSLATCRVAWSWRLPRHSLK